MDIFISSYDRLINNLCDVRRGARKATAVRSIIRFGRSRDAFQESGTRKREAKKQQREGLTGLRKPSSLPAHSSRFSRFLLLLLAPVSEDNDVLRLKHDLHAELFR
jgi:hypothetical protein